MIDWILSLFIHKEIIVMEFSNMVTVVASSATGVN